MNEKHLPPGHEAAPALTAETHVKHVAGAVAPVDVEYVPAAQLRHAVLAAAPNAVEYRPA